MEQAREGEKGGPGQMSQLLGTHHNRLDVKCRVSIPASFRAALKSEGDATVAMVLRPSHKHPCIEGWPLNEFQTLASRLERLSLFSDEHDDLAAALYADAFRVEADKEGRIVLPDTLITYAGLTDSVDFMGLGRIFQIWEPAAAERRRNAARESARVKNITLLPELRP
jgi:MraZ protein